MNFSVKIQDFLKKILPSPFSIAVLLTILSFLLAFFLTNPNTASFSFAYDIVGFWEKGFWELLAFSTQMMLILVLGHTLALAPIINKFISLLVDYCNTNAKAALIVTALTVVFSLLNWGLGLIFGAILARKVGEMAKKKELNLNYPLIGAAGYSGLMVWHGGFSGSAPLKIAEKEHFLSASIGQVPISETILSPMNISVAITLMIVLPIAMYFLAKKSGTNSFVLPANNITKVTNQNIEPAGVEKLDYSKIFARTFALLFIIPSVYKIINAQDLTFLNLNYINFLLFGLALFFHSTVKNFLDAVNKAIGGSAGILIQFPMYAGIMGIMKYSGLSILFTDFFIDLSNSSIFPVYTLISAGIVNIFVPSGGGQWIVQGPVIIEAAKQLNVPVAKAVMALAYGDQLTNMLQPFWALPLLGITGLKAKELIPYTLFLMGIGFLIFVSALLIF